MAFELTGLDREMSFLWNFGDGNFSSDPAPRHVFNRPGTYDITLSVSPPGDGSISTSTIQNMITVLPKPEAQLAWAFPSTVSGNKVRVQLKDETPTATSSQWVVDGESSRNGLVQLDVPGVYPVNMVVSNQSRVFGRSPPRHTWETGTGCWRKRASAQLRRPLRHVFATQPEGHVRPWEMVV